MFLKPDKKYEVFCDHDKITQVLINLINNAIKFTEKGKIGIRVKQDEKDIHITVADTGPGIRKEDLSKIFSRFTQLDTTKGKHREGTGLGLAICKAIIVKHKGKIWVESTFGEGSDFHFTIPMEKNE